MSDFTRQAQKAGFTPQQADFLDTMLAKFPHSHEAGDIEGLDETISEALEEWDSEVDVED